MDQVHAFLSAYSPKSICLSCLGLVTGRADADVRATVDALVSSREAATAMGYCLNCARRGLVVSLRAA